MFIIIILTVTMLIIKLRLIFLVDLCKNGDGGVSVIPHFFMCNTYVISSASRNSVGVKFFVSKVDTVPGVYSYSSTNGNSGVTKGGFQGLALLVNLGHPKCVELTHITHTVKS